VAACAKVELNPSALLHYDDEEPNHARNRKTDEHSHRQNAHFAPALAGGQLRKQ
jgi:hypothetical protein